MKKVFILLIIVSIIAVFSLEGCKAVAEEAVAEKAVAEKKVSIKIKAIVSFWDWSEDNAPYDIYSAIKQKLEKTGFEVVPPESRVYDATLFVDYKEEEGAPYGYFLFGPAKGSGTRITCSLRLVDKKQIPIFEKEIYASTPTYVDSVGDLYSSAVSDFENQVYFYHLGEIIASKIGAGVEVPVLICAVENTPAEAFADIGEPAVEPLIEALKDKGSNIRSGAANALGKIGDERAVEPLIKALKDEDKFVRSSAAWALGNIGDGRAVEPLIKALKDKDYDVRRWAAWALGDIGEPAVEPLIKALKDEVTYVRRWAAWALGNIGDGRAVEPLIKALKDKDWLVRRDAVEALGKINAKKS